ncbi:MAG TPA: hypothetical protein VM325_18345 [Alphaproteobacteria bacterium]|nr:hypothetical protein [Alphaproteobacteria bacterium]
MITYLPYLLGALAGSGVLAAWYGLKAVRDPEATTGRRRLGLVAVNVGVVLAAASLFLLSRGG